MVSGDCARSLPAISGLVAMQRHRQSLYPLSPRSAPARIRTGRWLTSASRCLSAPFFTSCMAAIKCYSSTSQGFSRTIPDDAMRLRDSFQQLVEHKAGFIRGSDPMDRGVVPKKNGSTETDAAVNLLPRPSGLSYRQAHTFLGDQHS
jgi:hypothetical protein